MNFDWKIVELAAWANLVLGGGWKIFSIVTGYFRKYLIERLALEHAERLIELSKLFATKEEVQEIHRELQELIGKHIH